MSELKVSVVIATRNRDDLLERSLRSVAQQTEGSLEAIVVDDGSSAETLARTRKLLSELGARFRLLAAPFPDAPGTGPAAARNRGVLAARGEFVACLDDDDQWIAPNFLEVAVQEMSRHGADYFFGHVEGERDGRVQDPGWVAEQRRLVREPVIRESPRVHLLSRETVADIAQHYLIHPSHSVIRRDTLVKAGGYFTRLWSYAEDANVMMRVLDLSRRVLYTSDTVTRMRNPVGGSVSNRDPRQEHMLQRVLAAQQARLACSTPELRRSARAYEAWTYRQMAQLALEAGHAMDANAFARQALGTYPTLGAFAFLVRTAVSAATRKN